MGDRIGAMKTRIFNAKAQGSKGAKRKGELKLKRWRSCAKGAKRESDFFTADERVEGY